MYNKSTNPVHLKTEILNIFCILRSASYKPLGHVPWNDDIFNSKFY